ncbi:MAG: O-antigen ligase family protein [Verrucomicrobia bacterium]|nr:O-antigen ligase family protein [Verrucomicrobiota bacterium]
MPRLPQPEEQPEDETRWNESRLPEPRLRRRGIERIETICDTIVLVLLLSVLVLTPLAFGGADQDLAPFSKTPFAPALYYFNYFVAAAAVLMAAAWVIKMLLTERLVLARTPVDAPLLLFLAYAVLRAATCASPTVAFREVGWLMAYAAIFYVTVNVLRTRRRQQVVAGAVVITALALTTMGLVMWLKPELRDMALTLRRTVQYSGRLGASYVCPNHFAGLLEMAIPLVLALVMVSKARVVTKLVAGAVGVVLVVGLILSMSRGGWISLALGIVFMLAMATWQKRINLIAWIVPLVVLVAVVVGVVRSDEGVQKRFESVFDSEDSSYAGRAVAWKHTLDLARRHLLFGTGPGTYRWAFTREQPADLPLDVRYTHNDYLHTWSDYGLVGLGLLLWGVGAFGYRGVRALRRAKKSADFALILGVLGSTTTIVAHSFVDFNMRIPANLITMLVLAAVLVAARQYQLRRMAEISMFKRSDTRRLPAPTKVLGVTAAAVAAVAILIINGGKHEARVAWHRGRMLDVTLPKPIGLKERTLEELDKLSGIPPEAIEAIRGAIKQIESPTAWQVRRQVELAGRRNGLDNDGVMRVTDALLRVQAIEESEEKVIAAYRNAARLDDSNFEFHAALQNFNYFKGEVRKRSYEQLIAQLARPKGRELVDVKIEALRALTESIGAGRRAFTLNPMSGSVAFGLGEAHKQMYDILKRDDLPGRLAGFDASHYDPPEYHQQQAREWYIRAVELHPNNAVFRDGYGGFLQWTGEYGSALEQYEMGMKLLEKRPLDQSSFSKRIEPIEERLRRRRERAQLAPPADTPNADATGPVENED